MIINDIKAIEQIPLGRAQDLTQKVFENFSTIIQNKKQFQ